MEYVYYNLLSPCSILQGVQGGNFGWLSPSSTRNGENFEYIRYETNILMTWFWMKMWCQSLLVVLAFSALLLPTLPRFPNKNLNFIPIQCCNALSNKLSNQHSYDSITRAMNVSNLGWSKTKSNRERFAL